MWYRLYYKIIYMALTISSIQFNAAVADCHRICGDGDIGFNTKDVQTKYGQDFVDGIFIFIILTVNVCTFIEI